MKKNVFANHAEISAAINTTSTYDLHKKMKTLIAGDKTGHNVSDLIIITFTKT